MTRALVRTLVEDHPWLIPAAVFLAAFGMFLSIQLIPGIPDPDSFYHVAMAEEIRGSGVVKDFHWLGDFTVLGETYADQHFLYHVFLIPFITLLPPFVGAKLATALLASLSVVVVYLLLRALDIRGAAWYALLLLLVNPYTFRMGLIKAPSLGVIGVFLLLLFAVQRRFIALFIASAVFVWTYGAFPLAFGAVGLYAFVCGVASWKTHGQRKRSRRERAKRLWRNEGRLILCTFLGMVAGLISSPYFPKNLRFYWIQTIQIAVVNFRSTIGVGGEWYPYGFVELVANTVFVSILAVIALVLGAIFIRRLRPHTFAFFGIALTVFMLTLKSRRYVEYEVPLVLLFAASAANDALRSIHIGEEIRKAKTWFWSHQVVGMILIVYLAVTVPAIAVKDYLTERTHYTNGIPVTQFQEAMQWLAAYHAETNPTGERPIIMHSDWDEFPILMYWYRDARYIAGLDPTFMYLYDPELHALWVDITTGKFTGDVSQTLRDRFHASYVFVAPDHSAMNRLLARDADLILLYDKGDGKIYQDSGVTK